ncbi:hypothetical protein [Photobacterium damselae]|uniref:Uncharacterized protein n=2 Tax=Photobacterium damselae TaxID=38293 RepID=D0Z526_PHODD|nr:hypothetical protein VDA_000259 [Photobacterium damselae subsp. damselae CIP 102761]SPY45190.1 Uncharacterised protein [Photobacterium damselae]
MTHSANHHSTITKPLEATQGVALSTQAPTKMNHLRAKAKQKSE